MKKIVLSTSIMLAAITVNAQTPTFSWAKVMGGTNAESGNSIATDTAGNVITVGNFAGAISLELSVSAYSSYGNNDVFITKHNSAGAFVWGKRIGGTSDDLVRGVTTDEAGNIYLTGNYNHTCDFDPDATVFNITSAGLGDIFVVKLDTAGKLIWAKSMGGGGADLGFAIAVDKDGAVYTTGQFAGTCDFDPGPGTSSLTSKGGSDIFVSKLDKDGNYEWARQMGGTNHEIGNALITDATNNVYLTGAFNGTADFDPSAATLDLTSAGLTDLFVVKLNSAGLLQWVKQMGGSGNDYGRGIVLDKWNNVITTGVYENTDADFDPGAAVFNIAGAGTMYISKLSNTGDFVWAKRIGHTSSIESVKGVAVDEMGGIYTVGDFFSVKDFDPGSGVNNITPVGAHDVFVYKVDSAGAYQWAVSMGGSGSENGNAIAIGKNASIHTTGYFEATADFNPGSASYNLTSYGFSDVFLSTLSQCIVNTEVTLAGSTLTASASGLNYQWVSCPDYTAIGGATGKNFTPSSSGDYAVIISNGTSCKDTSACISVVPSGITRYNDAATVNIYPNPSSNELNYAQVPEGCTLSISNALGQVVFSRVCTASSGNIDVSGFSKGFYIIKIVKEGELLNTQKLIISK